MKSFFKVLLSFSLAFSILLCGCSGTDAGPAENGSALESLAENTSAAANTTEVTTQESTTENILDVVEPTYDITLLENGVSEYTFVCDRNEAFVRLAVTEFAKKLKDDFGVDIKVRALSEASGTSEGAKEIIVGGVRNSGDELLGQLSGYNDFAMKVGKDTLTLAATNTVSYNYLFEYLYYEYFAKMENKSLSLCSEDDIVYSKSELCDMLYTEYHREKAGKCESDFMLKCFEDGTFKGTSGLSMKYRLYVPSDYDPNKEYPVIFFLHGAGHRGTDNAAPVKGIIYNLFNHKDPLVDDAIVLVPQCPSNYQWVDWPWAKGSYSVDAIPESKAMKTALELLDMVEKEYSTDKDRYYAFGLSMGGFGTWDVIMRHSDRFAAAVALCGGADPTKGEVLADMPIWTVHSLDDPSVPVKGTQDMVKAIKDAGGDKIHYDELNGHGHSVGTITAVRDEVFKWLFAQSK